MRFKRKQEITEAFQWIPGRFTEPDPAWLVKAMDDKTIVIKNAFSLDPTVMEIKTIQGMMYANVGDFLVLDEHGDIYPYTERSFRSMYEEEHIHPTMEYLQESVHEYAKSKGWYDKPVSFAELVSLVMCEAAEAIEEWRNGRRVNEVYYSATVKDPRPVGDGMLTHVLTCPQETQTCHKPEGVPYELADIVIRVMDICSRDGINLGEVVYKKHMYNMTRPYRHGNKAI